MFFLFVILSVVLSEKGIKFVLMYLFTESILVAIVAYLITCVYSYYLTMKYPPTNDLELGARWKVDSDDPFEFSNYTYKTVP